ncbi:aldo/keto reductase [Alteromonas lipolytica]|uniref:Aldo/keto reductase n=1 Tax=Alteromonas lipolytica TaxID=1856405 RepID=A0A1E8F8X0_9ALTE|nr:aldo/keto reductase [Alteromonas lipolytica]OFI32362.1 aldo/keto reductase [Alteromonas lipolytica]GGF86440.1 oxidoreductase [Alteromonas lipolytica]
MLTTQFPHASKVIFGCMGLGGNWNHQPYTKADLNLANKAVEQALSCGITVFDHADIYTHGNAEKVFAEVLSQHPDWREKMIIQSKCGIRFADNQGPKRYDFSPEWIAASLDGILSRLNIEQLDVLLLHRPDPLADLPEVADCLTRLHQEGKFRYLGVSNMHWYQIEALRKLLPFDIIANQLEMSLGYLDWVEDGICNNSHHNRHNGYTPGTLEYCQQNEVQLQAWAPLAQGKYSGKGESNCATSSLVRQLAAEYGVSKEAIVLGWLMRHPARIQPVIGTTNPARIAACAQAEDVTLSREHWYQLFESARGQDVP